MGKWTRRAFITTGVLAGGIMVVGIAIRPGNRAKKVKDLIGEKDDSIFNVWVKISPDNTITALVPHAEMGQGIHTTLAMMLADEMDADWSKVKVMEAPAHKEYANYGLIKGFIAGDKEFPAFLIGTVDGAFLKLGKMMNIQLTGGSSSVRFTGIDGMRTAGASARMMLVKAAAKEWDIPEGELTTSNSMVHHQATNRSATYAHLAPSAATFSVSDKIKLKSVTDYTLMGTSPQRLDIPQKVDGSAIFGIDIMLPGMKYATIKAAPVFGSKMIHLERNGAESIPGVLKVVNFENNVAVVADGYWQAKTAIDKISIEYETNSNINISQDDIFDQYAKNLDAEKGKTDHEVGNTNKALEQANKIFEAEYRVPFLAHATMEPMNATAWIHDGICEIWTGSQNPLGFAKDVAEAIDMDQSKVIIHNQYLGGGFGRRAETDVVRQVALIAKEVDYPVKLIWTREEDIRQDFYREATISRFKAAIDDNGKIVAWDNQYLFKHHPPEASIIPYNIVNQYIRYNTVNSHVPWGNWRSVDHSTHGFFIESFIDELAAFTNKDPYQVRKEFLNHEPRMLKALDMAAEKSGWKKELPENWGRGIAIHQSFGTIVSEVVHVEVSNNGELKIHNVVCVVDPGYAFHPEGLTAQMESGIIYGLTAALYGKISINNGAVEQSNFHDYKMLRINETPRMETYIINSGHRPGGAGEPSTPVIAPALANAIFNATGHRIRELPIMDHDLTPKNRNSNLIGNIESKVNTAITG